MYYLMYYFVNLYTMYYLFNLFVNFRKVFSCCGDFLFLFDFLFKYV